MSRQDDLERRLEQLITTAVDQAHQAVAAEFSDLKGPEGQLRWLVVRTLVHRAVHFAVEAPGVEFCALATYLGEMIVHAHKLAHGDNPKGPKHRDVLH
jgi:hypothetical protein